MEENSNGAAEPPQERRDPRLAALPNPASAEIEAILGLAGLLWLEFLEEGRLGARVSGSGDEKLDARSAFRPSSSLPPLGARLPDEGGILDSVEVEEAAAGENGYLFIIFHIHLYLIEGQYRPNTRLREYQFLIIA